MGLTFIHIPKTAGTSVELALGRNLLDSAVEDLDACCGKIVSPELKSRKLSSEFLQHLRLDEIEQLHPDFVRSSWAFTVVRDPWTRLLSSYRRRDRSMADFARWRHGIDLHSLDLEQYVELAASHDLFHLRAQSTFLKGLAKVQIFHFEHLSQLMHVLSRRLGRPIELPRINGPLTTVPKLSPRREAALRTRVAEIYEEDYQRFYPDQRVPDPEPGISGLIRNKLSAMVLRLGGR
jgi:hypothetical protein